MKVIRKLIYFLLILFFITVIVSTETDFFAAIERYMPEATQKYPVILTAAEKIEKMTEPVPSFSQIIASVKNEPLPIDPEDIAKGTYNQKSPMLNFYQDETAGLTMDGNDEITVFGIFKDREKANVLVQMVDENDEEVLNETIAVSKVSCEFKKNIKIPKTTASSLTVNIYTSEKGYGEYSSWAIDVLRLEKISAGWKTAQSPVAESNRRLYGDGKGISDALKETEAIKPQSVSVKSIATQLTENLENDYDKILALHDWVCSYLYYNIDYVNNSKIAPFEVKEVLNSRKVVCLGYSNLFAALCRSINIPCYVVSGYALGVDSEENEWNEKNMYAQQPNHAWNEAYVNGRWVIVDTTWDSFNRYENGEMKKAEKISHLYFDSNPEFFSANHKIIEYLRN